MNYWLGMSGVLLVGYALINWSGRVNEKANESSSGSNYRTTTGKLGNARSLATLKSNRKARYQGENEGNYGGEA
jgi:Flp pilus assembly protein TadB